MSRDRYYRLFQVDGPITETEIKKRYHRLALQFHPDHNKGPNAQKEFEFLQEAYAYVLKHGPDKKAAPAVEEPSQPEGPKVIERRGMLIDGQATIDLPANFSDKACSVKVDFGGAVVKFDFEQGATLPRVVQTVIRGRPYTITFAEHQFWWEKDKTPL